jgi:KaiC/GvpD/RAD55 family RecA-like ATPase
MLYVLLAAEWLKQDDFNTRSLQGYYTQEDILKYNAKGYNVYFYPNYPSLIANPKEFIKGHDIDVFEWVFVDLDMKHGAYESKEQFINSLSEFPLTPTRIVDSGNGIHAYWKVSDLDAISYLKLQRRLMRHFNTDDAVAKIKQLMRVPGTFNTKDKNNFKECELLFESENIYTSEQLDQALSPLKFEDEQYCKQHYDKTYNVEQKSVKIQEKIPLKFAKLLDSNAEVKDIWSGNVDDRSKGDYRLGHLMFSAGFTKEEATSVLVNSAKALSRSPNHRLNYAINIVDKIWTFEISEDKQSLLLSSSIKDILTKGGDAIKGTRFPCWNYLDATLHGFRLGQVIGLVAGSGVGKTAVALNMFLGFVQNNPDYDHFFVSLEQPANEIADRWKTMCGDQDYLYEKVHVISNYDDNSGFRHLSFNEIKDYIIRFQEITGRKVGCVVVDHIGALKKKGKEGENQDLMTICHEMKAFAVQTNTMLVMQSQAPREKAGIGDLELNKDAAYGTVYFESYCDYLLTIWQPLKRCYNEGAPTVTAFKFCKIRHKKQGFDIIKEDTPYKLMFDPTTEHLRELTQDEEASFTFFLNKATNKRKQDRKTDVIQYTSVKTTQ